MPHSEAGITRHWVNQYFFLHLLITTAKRHSLFTTGASIYAFTASCRYVYTEPDLLVLESPGYRFLGVDNLLLAGVADPVRGVLLVIKPVFGVFSKEKSACRKGKAIYNNTKYNVLKFESQFF